MVYKRIKKGARPGVSKKGGPNDKGTFKQGQIGQDTAKRMQDKLGKLKQRRSKDDEDEIKSNESDEYINRTDMGGVGAKKNELFNDPFLQDSAATQEMETIEEKRLRMANQIIEEYAKEDKNDFFDQLHAKTQHEEEIMEAGDDAITRRMKMHLLEKKGKLFYTIANDFTGYRAFEGTEEELKGESAMGPDAAE